MTPDNTVPPHITMWDGAKAVYRPGMLKSDKIARRLIGWGSQTALSRDPYLFFLTVTRGDSALSGRDIDGGPICFQIFACSEYSLDSNL